MLSKISENGDVTAICVGTGIMPSTVFYYNRPTQENDPMGEGPVLRALVEMIDAPKYTEISANDQYDRINLPVGKLSLSCQRVYVRMLNQNALLSLFLLQKFR